MYFIYKYKIFIKKSVTMTKKISLNELRNLIKEIIKEENKLSIPSNSNINEVEGEIMNILKGGLDKVVYGIEKGFNSEVNNDNNELNEGFLTLSGIIIAMPTILSLISKFGKWGGNVITKKLGKKPDEESEYQLWMSKLGEISDDLHHLYLKPINSVVRKFVKDVDKANKITNVIFHIIVGWLLVSSGVTAVKAFKARHIKLSTLEGALTAIKTGEVSSFIRNFIGLGGDAVH